MNPNAAYLTLSRRLLTALLVLSCVLASLIAGNSYAQTTAKSPPAEATSYTALADLLENDKARDQLVDKLRALASEDTSAKSDKSTADTANKADTGVPSLSQRLADSIDTFLAGLAGDFSETASVVAGLATGSPVADSGLHRWSGALNVLAFALATVLISYIILRLLARFGFSWLNVWIRRDAKTEQQAAHTTNDEPVPHQRADTTLATENAAEPTIEEVAHGPAIKEPEGPGQHRFKHIALSRKLIGVAAALGIDISATLLAALAGYTVTLSLAGTGSTSLFAFEFINAFVMVEAVKALSRGLFATRYDQLRLLPLSPEAANYWNLWISRLITATGYALLFIVPLANTLFPESVSHIVGLIIMLGVYVYAVGVVWKNRKTVRAGLLRHADQASAAIFGTLTRVLARVWHIVAILYFTVLLIVSQIAQQEALRFMGRATLQSAISIGAGVLLAAALTKLLERHLSLPHRWRDAVPSLEARVNSYVPAFLRSLRLLILIVVSLVVLDAWHAFDLAGWLESKSGQSVITHLVRIGLILGLAALSWTVVASLIEHRLTGSGASRRQVTERQKTLLMLFRNAAAILIGTMTILILLSQIGINIGPLIAGAGVAGLAIGFGAQKLVQDVITGIFIQLENGMNQNDIVEVAGLFGTVEKITIRSVVVRTLDGGYHLIPFSVIDRVSNHTRDFGYHLGEYNIAHRESVDEAIAQLELAFQDLMKNPTLSKEVMSNIDIPGVTALNERGFTIRVLIKTTPGNQWAVQRAFNRLVKERFDAAGIELPYPQTVLHFGRDKDGYAAPAEVHAVEALKSSVGKEPPPGQTMRPLTPDAT
ncbi:mechanosensitive ion channel domain-containing protein [Allopusillimonas ginsengisoli]|uniref:mechanosensitive ion channel domain-containing protein n=1 Tax=Allopusillimonas ginsengisoli TaxID=453575 RepID=UPI0039C3492A